MIKKLLLALFLPLTILAQSRPKSAEFDVCIYGGTSAGVIAAYTAQKLHKKVLLIEPGARLGGLSSGGLGFTDIGNKYVVTGLARDFYRRIGQHYGRFEQWTFEPKVADSIFRDYVKRGGFTVWYKSRLKRVDKKDNAISAIVVEDSGGSSQSNYTVRAKQFIDCSYEGDLMAMAGVSYTTGRESNATYNETVNGVQLRDKHQFPDGIDPYREPGQPESGLLWGISPEPLADIGSGDKKIQAYNFRICLSNDPVNRIAITRPANYDSTRYELLLRYLAAKPAKDLWAFLKMDLMPNRKTDINNNGPFSTDMIGMNYDYPDGSYAVRDSIFRMHEDYTKGFLYFVGHDARMPAHLREQMLQWGYPKDEYPDNNHWTPQLYVREARRMLGRYVMTQANCQAQEVVPDGIGMAAYTMDSHNAQRVVVNGMVKNEGDVQLKGINPYPIAYRSITPRTQECSNLLVPVCLSASHMAYGSIRMEPVFMVLGQSAAVAACMAIDRKTAVQAVDVKQLQSQLKNNPLADNSMPEVLVDNDYARQVTITGNWQSEKAGGYGPSYLKISPDGQTTGSVRFSAAIQKAGRYQVYVYCPKVPQATDRTRVTVFNGKQKQEKSISKNDIQVIGQTSGEWVSLGVMDFPPGNSAYVEITTEAANGVVVADAVLFVPQA